MAYSRNSNSPALYVAIAVATMLSIQAAQFVQQGDKLVATRASTLGSSVALSGDGNTAIVGGSSIRGGPNDGGGAWVYTRTGGVWSQQGSKLAGSGAILPFPARDALQGTSVALSADGNTALVGGPDDNLGVGATWVFTRSAGIWTQQGDKLVGTGGSGGVAFQGDSVALSADGNTALVGGPEDGTGAAWVFTRSGGVWTQQGPKLVSASGVLVYGQGPVSLSGDGNTAIIGAPGDGIGGAWVFTRTSGIWSQQSNKLVGTGAVGNSYQGSVALSADGNTAIVGGPGDNGNTGAAWVYTRSGGAWSQQGGKLVGTGAIGNGWQGVSVALSGDGNIAIVGGYADNFLAGAAWVYTRTGGVWSQEAGKLMATETSGEGAVGSSAALSADGSTIILGGPDDNAAWVFVQTSSPTIAPGGVVNGASFQAGIAPGTWITITGANLSASTRTWTAADFSGSNLPTQLDGVSVAVNGRAAYVSYISPTQLNLLTPDDATFDIGQGSAAVQVITPQGNTNAVTASEAAFSPGLFTFKGLGGQSFVAAVFPNGIYTGQPGTIPGYTTATAKSGDTIMLFGTGFGPTIPPSQFGQLLNPAPLASPVTVEIGGIPAPLQFAGIVGPGLYQFNVVVPKVQSEYNLVVATIGANSSQANVFLTVQ